MGFVLLPTLQAKSNTGASATKGAEQTGLAAATEQGDPRGQRNKLELLKKNPQLFELYQQLTSNGAVSDSEFFEG